MQWEYAIKVYRTSASTSGFGFRRERYTPDIELPALGDQGAVYIPTGDDFLADAMTGFTRGSHGDIVANNAPPLSSPDFRTWDADGGTYVEKSTLTRTTFEEGWEDGSIVSPTVSASLIIH